MKTEGRPGKILREPSYDCFEKKVFFCLKMQTFSKEIPGVTIKYIF